MFHGVQLHRHGVGLVHAHTVSIIEVSNLLDYFASEHVGLHYSSIYCDFIELDASECN
jgi:hypothetical protein